MRVATKIILSMILLSLYMEAGKPGLQLVEKWEHKEEKVTSIHAAIVDQDGWLICTFFNLGNRIISPHKVIHFAPFGQGPSDVLGICSLSIYGGKDLAIMESPERIKIFQKKGETYERKESIWLKRTPFYHAPNRALFDNDKWFIAGYEELNREGDKVSFLRIHDGKGNFLKNDVIVTKFTHQEGKKKRFDDLRRYLVKHNNHFFYFVENELMAHVISIRNLTVEKVVSLPPPYFYKKMPGDFFSNKKYTDGIFGLAKDLNRWRREYSRITAVVIDGHHLILQIRTCDPKLEKFALLVYNVNTWGEEGIIFTDDLLLGTKDGRLYFFANGDPGLDEKADRFTINIYTLK